MTKREAEELIEIEIDGTEKPECTEERSVFSEFTTFYNSQHTYLKIKVQFFGRGALFFLFPTDLSIWGR